MNPVRCILIDPKAQTVTVVECDVSRLEPLYALLDCRYIETTQLPGGDHLVLDEEGLIHDYRGQGYFLWGGHSQPLVGRAAIFAERDGEFAAPRTTLAEARAAVRFITPDVARSMLGRRGPFFGA